jgi:hypothetical protein
MAAAPSSAAPAQAACVELRRGRPPLPRALTHNRPPSPALQSAICFFSKKSNIFEKCCNILQNIDKKIVDETNISEKCWNISEKCWKEVKKC